MEILLVSFLVGCWLTGAHLIVQVDRDFQRRIDRIYTEIRELEEEC